MLCKIMESFKTANVEPHNTGNLSWGYPAPRLMIAGMHLQGQAVKKMDEYRCDIDIM